MITKKRSLCLLVLFCLLVASLAFRPLWAADQRIKVTVQPKTDETTPEKSSDQNQPHITIESSQFDAGDVWEGETVTHTFKVKNTGTGELLIKSVKPG